MTSATQPIRRARQRLTYARARLYFGMTAVGSAALGATWLLVALTPSRWITDSPTQSLLHTLATMAIIFVGVLVAGVLPDMIGGALLVRHRTMVGVWFARWLRGAVVQFAVWMFAATAFVLAARANTTQTTWLVVGVFVFLQLLLAQFRGAFARVVASLPIQTTPERIRTAAALAGFDAKSVVVVETPDEGSSVASPRLPVDHCSSHNGGHSCPRMSCMRRVCVVGCCSSRAHTGVVRSAPLSGIRWG